jgi:hypothetical protein
VGKLSMKKNVDIANAVILFFFFLQGKEGYTLEKSDILAKTRCDQVLAKKLTIENVC